MRFLLLAALAITSFATSLAQQFPTPINGVTTKSTLTEKRPLAYDHVREADVMWEKTIWRIIDVREKMNHPFAYPIRPFFTILTEAAEQGKIQLYANDNFTEVLSESGRKRLQGTVDTVETVNVNTGQISYVEVVNTFDVRDVKRYRVKEVWYVDRESSTLKVRILGISPLKDEYDENGNFLYELPLFWVYYPGAREVLTTEVAPLPGYVAAPRSWEDLLESRYFSSMILKESNLYDRRISAYLVGRDALLKGDRIDQGIFNFEMDLWSE